MPNTVYLRRWDFNIILLLHYSELAFMNLLDNTEA